MVALDHIGYHDGQYDAAVMWQERQSNMRKLIAVYCLDGDLCSQVQCS